MFRSPSTQLEAGKCALWVELKVAVALSLRSDESGGAGDGGGEGEGGGGEGEGGGGEGVEGENGAVVRSTGSHCGGQVTPRTEGGAFELGWPMTAELPLFD